MVQRLLDGSCERYANRQDTPAAASEERDSRFGCFDQDGGQFLRIRVDLRLQVVAQDLRAALTADAMDAPNAQVSFAALSRRFDLPEVFLIERS